MKKKSLSLTVFLLSFILFACTEAGEGSDPTGDSLKFGDNDTPKNTSTTPLPPPDSATAEFMTEASSGGMMEVELGQMAQQQAKEQRVKNFGAMMVTDHTKANDELKSIATAKSFSLPGGMLPDHQHHIDNLKSKSGAAFDKAYIKMMVDDHQKDVSSFEKAVNTLGDSEVKAFATRTLPTLKAHLDSAKAISKKM